MLAPIQLLCSLSVIAKNLHSNVELPEDDLPIPQWAIVVIVIGVGSLVFVVIFGVTVVSIAHFRLTV